MSVYGQPELVLFISTHHIFYIVFFPPLMLLSKIIEAFIADHTEYCMPIYWILEMNNEWEQRFSFRPGYNNTNETS